MIGNKPRRITWQADSTASGFVDFPTGCRYASATIFNAASSTKVVVALVGAIGVGTTAMNDGASFVISSPNTTLAEADWTVIHSMGNTSSTGQSVVFDRVWPITNGAATSTGTVTAYIIASP